MIRFSIKSLLMLMAAFGFWMAGTQRTKQALDTKSQISGLRFLAREIDASDPTQIYVREGMPNKITDETVDFFVPTGGEFVLHFSDKEAGGNESPPPFNAVPVANGIHRLQVVLSRETKLSGWLVQVLVDDDVAFERQYESQTSIHEQNFTYLTGGFPVSYHPSKIVTLYQYKTGVYFEDRSGAMLTTGDTPGLYIRLQRVENE